MSMVHGSYDVVTPWFHNPANMETSPTRGSVAGQDALCPPYRVGDCDTV